MAKYLDKEGLGTVWTRIKQYVTNYVTNYAKITTPSGTKTITIGEQTIVPVEAVTGKGLSTNDYTTDEKNKLAGIAAGAEVNLNAFSNVKVGSTTVLADGKTDTLELAVAANGVLSAAADTTNDKVTFTVDTDLSKYDNTTSDFITSASLPTATTTTPKMNGTAAVGTETHWAKGDHVHPTDTSRAPLNSPQLTGSPTAPTATAGTNTTQIATTEFVTTAVLNAQTGAAMFLGTVSQGSLISSLTDYKIGWYWVVSAAGTYVGETCEPGDMIYCVSNYSSSYSADDFNVVQRNLDIAAMTDAEIEEETPYT